ncbi:MAG: FAD binding domain-containing protein, partial [Litoreibacter sp.]|nr:FAD binding domain-containing protein [Litoreibacter sp.]
MHNFDFVRPSTLAEATAAMQAEGAQALGGGQTLMPVMKQRLAAPDTLVSLAGIAEMIGVCEKDGALVIGGATTHAQVASDAASMYPALAALAGMIGDPAVRSRGTVGGSLANNDPAACYPAGALGSGATITTNTREISSDNF